MEPTPKRKAYSYRRYSSPEQGAGDSLRRQEALLTNYLARNPSLVLDTSLMVDRGVSAFRSSNTEEGTALASFLAEVKAGRVPVGSALIVENLDRISRDTLDPAFDLVRSILKSGIDIITLSPEYIYPAKNSGDIGMIFSLLVTQMRANDESRVKSERESNRRQEIRAKTANGEIVPTKVLPGWLTLDGTGKGFVVVPERAAVVRRVFAMAATGMGTKAIARTLMDEGVPPWGKPRKKQISIWEHSFVWKILKDRKVLGEMQPTKLDPDARTKNGKKLSKGRPMPAGSPVAGYYPRIIDDELFNAVRAATQGRARQRGRGRGDNVKNLFSGLLVDSRDGSSVHLVDMSRTYGTTKHLYQYLISERAIRHEPGSVYVSFPYPVFESTLLLALAELNPQDVTPSNGTVVAELARLTGRLSEINATLTKTQARVKAGGVVIDAYLDIIADLTYEQKQVKSEIETLTLATGDHAATGLQATRDALVMLTHWKTEEERVEARAQVKRRISMLVEKIYCLAFSYERKFPGGKRPVKMKHMFVQVHFVAGGMRWIEMSDKGYGQTEFSPQIPANRDLRTYQSQPWELGEWEINPLWINPEGEWPLVIKSPADKVISSPASRRNVTKSAGPER